MIFRLISVSSFLLCLIHVLPSLQDPSRRFLFDAIQTICCQCDDSDPDIVDCRNVNCYTAQKLCPVNMYCKTYVHVTYEGRVLTKKSCGYEDECVQGYYDQAVRHGCQATDKSSYLGLQCTSCCKAPSVLNPLYCLKGGENINFNFTGYTLPYTTKSSTQAMPVTSRRPTTAKSTSQTTVKSTAPATVTIHPPITMASKAAKCYTCSKPGCQETIEECTSHEPLCMNAVIVEEGKKSIIKKSCVSYSECYNDAYLQQRNLGICKMDGASIQTKRATVCLYCCNSTTSGTPCNAATIPTTQVQYTTKVSSASTITYKSTIPTASLNNKTTVPYVSSALTNNPHSSTTSYSSSLVTTLSVTSISTITDIKTSLTTPSQSSIPPTNRTTLATKTTLAFSATPLSIENTTYKAMSSSTALLSTIKNTVTLSNATRSKTTFSSLPTNASVTSETTSPTNASVTSEPTSSTNASVTSETTSPTNASVTSKTTSPTNASVTSKTTSPTNASVTSETTSPTVASVTSETTSPTDASVTSETTSPTNSYTQLTFSQLTVSSTTKVSSTTASPSLSSSSLKSTTNHVLSSSGGTTKKPGPYRLPAKTTECVACSGPLEICEQQFETVKCEPPNNYCINILDNNVSGSRTVNRTCGNFGTCYREWYLGTSDNDRCLNFDERYITTLDFSCTFCCTEPNCNKPVVPSSKTLYNINGP